MSFLVNRQPQSKTIIGQTPKDSHGLPVGLGDWVKIDGKRYKVSSIDSHVVQSGSDYELWEWTLQAEVSDATGYFHAACPTWRCEVCEVGEEE